MDSMTPIDTTAAMTQAAQVRIDGGTRSLKDAAKGSHLDAKTLRRIDAAAKDFEATFMAEMMKPMFEGVKVDETFGGGKGEEVFRDMLTQEYGKKIAQSGGIGIASAVRAEMIRQQEGVRK